MRVLMIDQGGRGGVADYTGELVRALHDAGAQVELATATDHRIAVPDGVRVHPVFPYLRAGGRLRDLVRRVGGHKAFNALGYLVGTLRLLPAVRRADVVHYQGNHVAVLLLPALALMRLVGARVVHTPHNTFQRSGDGRADRLRRRNEARPAAVIVHARADLGQLEAATRAKAVVVPHGEYGALVAGGGTAPPRSAARSALGLPAAATVALVFGQLRRDKGIGDLLLAARDEPALHVVLAGEDLGALDAARSLLDDPALRDRVLVRPGFVSLPDATTLFAACDVTVLAYERASASGVLLLSYGFARPVVAYPVGGLPEVVRDGETGWLCARADVDALRETLRGVVAAGPEEAARRGAAGRAFSLTELAWPRIAERTLAVYRDVVAPKVTGG